MNPGSSQSSSKKDSVTKGTPPEVRAVLYTASTNLHTTLEDVSNKAYELGVKAGTQQAKATSDCPVTPAEGESQAIIDSLCERNDELEKQIKSLSHDVILALAKDARDNVTSAYRAVLSATNTEAISFDNELTLGRAVNKLLKLQKECNERVDQISRVMTKKRSGESLDRASNKRPSLG